MPKPRLKLTAKETDAFYDYLCEVMKKVEADTIALRIIFLNTRRVITKLHVKSMANESANMILLEEHALALQYLILTFPVPPEWVFTANVARIVQEQLPALEIETKSTDNA